jgi:hypothetical protein
MIVVVDPAIDSSIECGVLRLLLEASRASTNDIYTLVGRELGICIQAWQRMIIGSFAWFELILLPAGITPGHDMPVSLETFFPKNNLRELPDEMDA